MFRIDKNIAPKCLLRISLVASVFLWAFSPPPSADASLAVGRNRWRPSKRQQMTNEEPTILSRQKIFAPADNPPTVGGAELKTLDEKIKALEDVQNQLQWLYWKYARDQNAEQIYEL